MQQQNLIETVRAMVELPTEELAKMAALFKPQLIRKNDFFIRAGQPSNKIGFNISGLFRYYYADAQGREYTKYLCLENHFIVSYSAMILQCDSRYAIEALEDSEVLVADCKAFNRLFADHPAWQTFARKLLEETYIYHEKREQELILDNAETRYLRFLAEYPGIEARMKQYHVASYLGITPVALSRIRAKIALS